MPLCLFPAPSQHGARGLRERRNFYPRMQTDPRLDVEALPSALACIAVPGQDGLEMPDPATGRLHYTHFAGTHRLGMRPH
eukprot:5109096-Pyramimonas_sp.AAC.1